MRHKVAARGIPAGFGHRTRKGPTGGHTMPWTQQASAYDHASCSRAGRAAAESGMWWWQPFLMFFIFLPGAAAARWLCCLIGMNRMESNAHLGASDG